MTIQCSSLTLKLHNMQFSGRDGDERDGRDSAKSSKSSRFPLSN